MSIGSSQRPPLYAPFTPLRFTTSNIQILLAQDYQDYHHSKIHQYTMIKKLYYGSESFAGQHMFQNLQFLQKGPIKGAKILTKLFFFGGVILNINIANHTTVTQRPVWKQLDSRLTRSQSVWTPTVCKILCKYSRNQSIICMYVYMCTTLSFSFPSDNLQMHCIALSATRCALVSRIVYLARFMTKTL